MPNEKLQGFGIVYRCVMRNTSLTPEAKAIYSYLCSFAGSQNTCYPSRELMQKELGMSKTRFYKHLQLLIDSGVISKQQERTGQRLGRTIYTINHGGYSQIPIFEETEDCERPDFVFPYSVVPSFEDHNNNSLNNNRDINSNRTYMSDPAVCDKLCSLINEGKRRAGSKGRVKIGGAVRCVADLIHDGKQISDIIAAAQEAANKGINLDWYSFPRYCKSR